MFRPNRPVLGSPPWRSWSCPAPATGTSTVAEALGRALDLPVLSIDPIKEALADSLAVGGEEWSLFVAEGEPLGLAGGLVVVDTTDGFDADALSASVRAALSGDGPPGPTGASVPGRSSCR